MNREFLLNALFLIFINVLIKPFYVFGIERTIQDTVGAETYGLYATLFSFSFLLFMVNDFGIHYFNNTTIAKHPQLIGKYFPNILVLKILLTGLYLVLVFAAAFFRRFEPGVYYLLFFIALNHVLISLVSYLRSNISGLGLYRIDSAVSTLDKLLLIGVCAFLLWGPWHNEQAPFQIEWFVHAQNLTWFLTALTAFLIVKTRIREPLRLQFNGPMLLLILKKSAPFALAVFLMTAYTRFDIVILEWILPDGRYEAGVYAAAYRLLDAFNMVGFLFAGLLLPMFSTMLAGRRSESPAADTGLDSLLRLRLHLIWAGTVTIAMACFFFREELMHWMYPVTATAYYGEVLGFIILTLIPFSGIFIYSTLLTANGSLKKMNVIFLAGIVVNISLNLLLIPGWKATGAGFSAFLTQAVVLVSMMLLARKELRLKTDRRQVIKIIAFFLLVILVNWQLYRLPGLEWLLKFCLGIVSGLLLAFFLRLIRVKMLLSLLKKEERIG